MFLRVIANILVAIVLASSTYAIYLVVERSREVEDKLARGESVGWWDQNEVGNLTCMIECYDDNRMTLRRNNDF